MSIKDAVAKQKEAQDVEVKGNIKGGSPSEKPADVPTFKPTFEFGGATNASEWFLDRTGEMEVVTDEDHNMELGIRRIMAFGASKGQQVYGTIANVTLETVLGKITGIQVRESTRNPGSLFIGTSSRKVEKEGNTNYYNDIELSRPVEAQILSWIYPQLTKNN